MKKIILASTSPRRKELLAITGLDFTVVPSNYEEDNNLPLAPAELVKELALGKAKDVAERNPDALVIGADTLVFLDNEVIGKVPDKESVIAILKKMSGRSHSIITGVALIEGDKVVVKSAESKVFFREMSDDEIVHYVDISDWHDKAGGYAIQTEAALFIEKIEGDYFNIVGLPLNTLGLMLREFGITVPA